MNITEIKSKIKSLAKKHHDIDEKNLDDFDDAEFLEIEAEELIFEYSENKGYQVRGFPHEKRKLNDAEHDEDYFSLERYRMYSDHLALSHDDVADLKWFYVDSFWPEYFKNKEQYIDEIKSGFKDGWAYDIEF